MRETYSEYLLGIIIFILVFSILKIAGTVVVPIVIAFLLAMALSPVSSFLSKLKLPPFFIALLIILLLLISISLIGLFVYSSIWSLARQFPKYEARYYELLELVSSDFLIRFNLNENIFYDFNWGTSLRIYLLNASSYFMNFISYIGIVLLLLFFLLFEFLNFEGKFRKAFNIKTSSKILTIVDDTIKQISHYLAIKTLISLMTGVFTWLFLTLIGMDFAVMFGALAFLFNFIPNIGSIVITLLCILWSFIQFFPNPGPIIAVTITISVFQMIVGQFIDPALQGRRLNLSTFIIITSLLFWGWMWGIIGAFIAVPITAIIKIICQSVPRLKHISVLMESAGRFSKKRYSRRP